MRGTDRTAGGGDRGGAGAAAAAAAQDAARQAGPPGGDNAQRAQRQPHGLGGGGAAVGGARGHALPVDRAPAGQSPAGLRRGHAALRRGGDPARLRGRHGGAAPGPEQGLGPAPDAGAERAGGWTGPDPGVAGAGGPGGRPALPATRRETRGAIGFAEQRELIARVAAWLPAGGGVVLMGDRFYGTPDLIALCRALGWGWRLRLKQDLLVFADGGETTLAACFARGERMLDGIELTGKRVATNVAMVHEPGHPEPWIIALSEAPTVHRAFDHGLRWGIEAMFSDFKSRGFGLEDSQLRHPDRLARLLLVMALALHWAVSTGMWEAARQPLPAEKKPRRNGRGRWPAAEPPPSGAACAASSASFSS